MVVEAAWLVVEAVMVVVMVAWLALCGGREGGVVGVVVKVVVGWLIQNNDKEKRLSQRVAAR